MAQPVLWKEYEDRLETFETFAPVLESLTRELVTHSGHRIHSVVARVKEKPSLERKIAQSPTRYGQLDDVTDFLGVRIITYFPDEVDQVASTMENEFEIDWPNSVDRRATLDPDRFGYLSLHYVATLAPARCALLEYKRFHSCRFEIQIRSILQHAWAEIEHDLGYKTAAAIPREVRRRFSRLAGLLEICDDEFAQIREDLESYNASIQQEVERAPESVYIDQASLSSFVLTNPLVHRLDEAIAEGWPVSDENASRYVGGLVPNLEYVGLVTIKDVEQALTDNADIITVFAYRWMREEDYEDAEKTDDLWPPGEDVPTQPGGDLPTEPDGELEAEPDGELENDLTGTDSPFSRGISLFYLCYVLAAATESPEVLRGYLETAKLGEDIARPVFATYRGAVNQLDEG